MRSYFLSWLFMLALLPTIGYAAVDSTADSGYAAVHQQGEVPANVGGEEDCSARADPRYCQKIKQKNAQAANGVMALALRAYRSGGNIMSAMSPIQMIRAARTVVGASTAGVGGGIVAAIGTVIEGIVDGVLQTIMSLIRPYAMLAMEAYGLAGDIGAAAGGGGGGK